MHFTFFNKLISCFKKTMINKQVLNLLLFTFFVLICQQTSAQWTYKTNREFNKDIIINYTVSYEKELTESQKKSPNFIKEIIIILNKNKLIEKTIRYPYNKSNLTMYDYTQKQRYKLFANNKSGFSYDFKKPENQATLLKTKTTKILGLNCNQYSTTLNGKKINLFTTKDLGLRFVKKYNIDGLLMFYTAYDKKLGYYTVKANRINNYKLPINTYSLDNYKITPYKTYISEYLKRKKDKQKLIKNSIGKKSPKFYVRTINNKKISSKKMLGNKVVVLNFWFHTCPPCKKEIPKLNELQNQYKDDDEVTFIAIGLDDKTTINKFLKQHPIDYDIVDDGRWLANKFEITSYPTNIIIDKNGVIQFFEIGYKSSIKGLMTNKIDELLDE